MEKESKEFKESKESKQLESIDLIIEGIRSEINKGNSNISIDEAIDITKTLINIRYNNIEKEVLSATKAYQYLRISRSKFFELKKMGIIKGYKILGLGFIYLKSELDAIPKSNLL